MTTCIFLETTYLILATLQMVAGGKEVLLQRGKFYRLPPDKENTEYYIECVWWPK